MNKDLPFDQAMGQIKQGFLDNVLSRATDSTGNVAHNQIIQNLRPNTSIGTTARQIFSEQELSRLNNVLDVASKALTFPGGGSGSAGLAQIGAAVGLGTGIVRGDPETIGGSLAVLFAPRVLARIVTSPTLTNLATKGIGNLSERGATSKTFQLLSRVLGQLADDRK